MPAAPLFTSTFLAIAAALSLPAHAVESAQVTPLHPSSQWQRAEFRITGAPTAANNFDPDVIRLDASFISPSGATSAVPAFWYQDFTHTLVAGAEVLTASGAPGWRLRFTPTEAGEYRVALSAALNGASPSVIATSRFTVTALPGPAARGWVRVASDRRYFETTDGQALRLIGENVCWPRAGGTFDYEQWFTRMQQSRQNFARLWLAPWWAGLEHTPGTLTNYRLDGAWQLDRVFDLAEARGLYLLLCLDHHGMYMATDQAWGGSNNFWPRNPYARENGGPCASPNEFFTLPAARKIYQKRLRYLVARYGASPQLLAWQFFNEIDNSYIPRSNLVGADVASWHRAMARWLRAHDPYGHLITTSLTGGSDRPEIWQLPEMDFSMYHSYSDPAPGRTVARLAEDFIQRYHKPVMIGEFGVSASNWARPLDPHLRGFRQALWAGALGGSVGTSMSWWWEDIHDDRAYALYSALHDVLHRAGWDQGAWTPLASSSPGLPPTDLGEPLPDTAPFNASLALNTFRRILLSSDAAIATPLSAERSSEFLSNFLRGSRTPDQQRPLAVTAWFADSARLVVRVDSVASEAELVVTIDGVAARREKLGAPEPTDGANRKIDREFSIAVPSGKHRVLIANVGPDWAVLDSVRLERVRPSAYAGGWTHHPEVVGLRQNNKAVLYTYSPWMVFPAGQHRYDGPLLSHETITLHDWPAGEFNAEWHDPRTGRILGTTSASTRGGELPLAAPDFSDDLAAIVTPAK